MDNFFFCTNLKIKVKAKPSKITYFCTSQQKLDTNFKFFTTKIGFLYNALVLLIHPCFAGWSVSGIPRL